MKSTKNYTFTAGHKSDFSNRSSNSHRSSLDDKKTYRKSMD